MLCVQFNICKYIQSKGKGKIQLYLFMVRMIQTVIKEVKNLVGTRSLVKQCGFKVKHFRRDK